MFHDILNRQVFFDNSKVEASAQAKDLIKSLLKKDPEKRLGAKNENQIKEHPWFADMDFQKLEKKQVYCLLLQYNPQFIPTILSQSDVTNFDQEFTNESNINYYNIEAINSLVNTDILLLSKFEKEFEGLGFSKKNEEESQEVPSFSKKRKEG